MTQFHGPFDGPTPRVVIFFNLSSIFFNVDFIIFFLALRDALKVFKNNLNVSRVSLIFIVLIS